MQVPGLHLATALRGDVHGGGGMRQPSAVRAAVAAARLCCRAPACRHTRAAPAARPERF